MTVKQFKLVLLAVVLLTSSAPTLAKLLETTEVLVPDTTTEVIAREELLRAWAKALASDEKGTMMQAKALAMKKMLLASTIATQQNSLIKCKESGSSCIPGAQHDCCSGVCVPLVTIFYGVCY